jgi:N-acetyl-anhydromuramyl-L-alanine amidase AmpD
MSSADYRNATFYGAYTKNHTAADRPGSDVIDKIIVHVTQGSWSGALNWFNTKDQFGPGTYGVSAHYTVRSSDGVIGQSVHEKDIAQHAGNWEYNRTSIGIEHEGYVSDPSWFTDEMYRSSARLSAYLVKKYRIPLDRGHIIGHHEVPDPYNPGSYGGAGNHTDPGDYWDWDRYMSLVRQYATYKQVVDNASPRFRASDSWGTSSWSSQKLGKNYRFVRPKAVNDPAMFKVRIPKRGRYDIYARWPANSGYNSRARFRIRTAGGWVTRVRDQRQNGGRWVRLGTFDMDAGDGWWVRLLRNSVNSGYLIADGVLVREV